MEKIRDFLKDDPEKIHISLEDLRRLLKGRLDEAALEKMLREYKIHEDIMNIMNWVDSYRAAEGVMPESIDQLEEWSEAKVVWRPSPSLLRSLTRQDPWGRDYVYSPATPQGWLENDPFALLSAPARIICFGRDGKSGGEGDDKDIEVIIVDDIEFVK